MILPVARQMAHSIPIVSYEFAVAGVADVEKIISDVVDAALADAGDIVYDAIRELVYDAEF